MFGEKKAGKAKATQRIDTLIGKDTHFIGDIIFKGGLRVDGTITGNLEADEDNATLVTITSSGKIEGEIKVANIVINGEVNGNIYASQHLELAANAIVTGNVYYHLLEMAVGSQVNGQLIRVKTADELEEMAQIEQELVNQEDPLTIENKA